MRQPHPAAHERTRLTRPQHGRVLGGVCSGLGARLGLSVKLLRLTFVVAALLLNGAGVVAYLVLWAVLPQDDGGLRRAGTQLHAGSAVGRPASGAWARLTVARLARGDEAGRLMVLGLTCLLTSAVLVASRLTDQVDLSVLLPLIAVTAGIALGLGQLDRTERNRWLGSVVADGPFGWLRVPAGLLLIVGGVVLLLAPQLSPRVLLHVLAALVVLLLGVALVLGPWGRRLLADLEHERRERIRQQERAEITAHLHDSVLQTLALIQRRAHDVDDVARLARSQERQLREYLYGAPSQPLADDEPRSLAAAVRVVCAELEDEHAVPVEVVCVGDTAVDARCAALLQALREALLNAVRHGRVDVSVYVEAGHGVEAFVRDRGAGFDLETVPADRLGVRESVIGRMQRAGGSATVRRAPGGGTEVGLALPGP